MPSESESMATALDSRTTDGVLYEALPGGRVRCHACAHRCLILPGKRGVCKVRFNREGHLRVPFGYASGVQRDPVEKKPFYHVPPGSMALTFGMLGCDFHCSYCQNWITSQTLRDPAAQAPMTLVAPEDLVAGALQTRARLIVSSYNEPLITAEWAQAIFSLARPKGLKCGFVSNGNATAEVLDYLAPWLDCYKVDLKTLQPANYLKLGGQLEHVLWTIRALHERGLWLEVLTLLVPGFNDSDEELRGIARFIAGVSPEIPWHVTAFRKEYRMTAPADTPAATLIRACEIGQAEGLHYVYAGNRPGQVGEWENTRCPQCRTTLIKREGYHVRDFRIDGRGQCPACSHRIPGLWPSTCP